MIRINLLPAGLAPEPTQFNPIYPIAILGGCVAVFLFFNYHSQVSIRDQQLNEIAKTNSRIKELEPVIVQVESLEAAKTQLSQKKGIIQAIESERLRYPLLMDDVVRLLPGNVWLTSLVTSIAGNLMTVTMQVSALDNYALADLVSNLESSQIFTDTELGPVSSVSAATGGQTLNFQITTNYHKLDTGNNAIKKS